MDNTRKQNIEELMRKYYKAYDILAELPNDAISKLSTPALKTNSLKDKIVVDAMRIIAEVEPFLEKLGIDESEFLVALYGGNDGGSCLAEKIADDKGISRRSVFNKKRDILCKLDALLPQKLSENERAELFAKRWHR